MSWLLSWLHFEGIRHCPENSVPYGVSSDGILDISTVRFFLKRFQSSFSKSGQIRNVLTVLTLSWLFPESLEKNPTPSRKNHLCGSWEYQYTLWFYRRLVTTVRFCHSLASVSSLVDDENIQEFLSVQRHRKGSVADSPTTDQSLFIFFSTRNNGWFTTHRKLWDHKSGHSQMSWLCPDYVLTLRSRNPLGRSSNSHSIRKQCDWYRR